MSDFGRLRSYDRLKLRIEGNDYKYKCKVNFVKLPLIWIYLCLKLVFENATAGRNTGCRSVVNCARDQPTPTFPALVTSVESMKPPAVQTRFTRGRAWELKNGHKSVTVQNRTHVYMNFFHHKDLGNHLLQLCLKVVKHPVYEFLCYSVMWRCVLFFVLIDS